MPQNIAWINGASNVQMLWMPIVKLICIQRLIYDSVTIVTCRTSHIFIGLELISRVSNQSIWVRTYRSKASLRMRYIAWTYENDRIESMTFVVTVSNENSLIYLLNMIVNNKTVKISVELAYSKYEFRHFRKYFKQIFW